jgi:hypothetical protein
MPRSSFVLKITGIAPEVRLAHYVRATPYGKLYVGPPPLRFSAAGKDHQLERDKFPEECWPSRHECHPPH